MRLHEFQARRLLERYGVDIPRGIVASTEEEAERAAHDINAKVIIKAQVLTGGRGKAGGIVVAESPEEARTVARELFSRQIGKSSVTHVLVAEHLDIVREFYFGITVNASQRCVQCLIGSEGGVDIEATARNNPEKVQTFAFPPHDRTVPLSEATLSPIFGEWTKAAAPPIAQLLRMFWEMDCTLLEINPFAVTSGGRLMAADAKIILDDNALFRHPEYKNLQSQEGLREDEIAARKLGLDLVSLDGSIGCIVNGAGLAMATLDLVNALGGRSANFLDVGGSSRPEKMLHAIEILANNPRVKVILVNIFGGITRCDDIARGILMAREQLALSLPLVIRLAGTNFQEARELLEMEGITPFADMTEAIRAAVSLDGTRR